MENWGKHSIMREIGIDYGHRVTFHGSKCRSVHGHRGTVQAICEGPLAQKGEQEGMVLDFGFLKDEMMAEIDRPCDHGMILWDKDPLLELFVPKELDRLAIREVLNLQGHYACPMDFPPGAPISLIGKLYVIPFVPSAENLARHWFYRLEPRVYERSNKLAKLTKVILWETPNCQAAYPA